MNMNGDQPSDLPVFAADMDAAAATLQGGGGFWPDVERLTGGALAGSLDDALAGAAAPRVWLFVHEPGQPQLGVVAALTFARTLGSRDQAAIVLDGDDRTTVLSRWSGREEAEGWIDMVRYGTSVLTSGVALPFDGRTAYLLGVGSYAPTDITAEEVADLLGRLRRQADDLLIVCPLPTAGLWGKHADIVLLCVDRQTRATARIAELGAEMAAAGAAPAGVIGYGEPMAESAAEPVAETVEADPGEPVDEEEDMAALPPVDDVFAATDAVVEDALGDTSAGSVAEALAEAAPSDPSDSFDGEAPTRRSTSGVFWIAAVVSVVLIAVVAVYYFRFVRTGDDGLEAGPPLAAVQQQDAAPAAGTPQETGTETADGGTDDSDGTAAPADSQTVAMDQGDAPAAQQEEAPAGQPAATPVESPAETASDPAVATTTPADDTPAEEPAPRVDPFTEPVGRDGWALWVYSFPDSSDAARQVRLLKRRGITATVRIVEIADKGRWHRIYMGNFADRAAASAAKPELLERLREDWAQPVRFYASSDD